MATIADVVRLLKQIRKLLIYMLSCQGEFSTRMTDQMTDEIQALFDVMDNDNPE